MPTPRQAKIKFYNENKKFGFTKDDCFFHANAYCKFERIGWYENRIVRQPLGALPLIEQEIVILESQETERGISASLWCFPKDILPNLEWGMVLKQSKKIEESPLIADNEKKLYRQEVLVTITEHVLFIGPVEECRLFLNAHKQESLVFQKVNATPAGIDPAFGPPAMFLKIE